jgi:hypothetical protein
MFEKNARYIKVTREDAAGVLEYARKMGYEISKDHVLGRKVK